MADERAWHLGDRMDGFVVRGVTDIPDLRLSVIRLDHEPTGAEFLHLRAPDDNNLFGVSLRTPPTDSTGVAHILEHTVLCGSRRFPVRDPFFSMIKRSLSTFMNALTADDWTMYPFSSRNRKDFYNLMDVYLDAVFFPNLHEMDFHQEGHRLEIENPAAPYSPLVRKGVVYNEMKGAMSDPRSLLGHRLMSSLFPTSTYGHNSGGDPSEIPSLTWKNLREFHARYYHPSNARFFTYGDLPLADHLAMIQEKVLDHFTRIEVFSEVKDEPAFAAPVRVEKPFPVAPGEDLDRKTIVQVGWRGPSILDAFEVLSLRILSALLLGNPAAPLYRALLESRLGLQIAPGSGYADENKATVIAAGLQGVSRADTNAVEEVIFSTLEKIRRDGFPGDRIEAAIHRLEFANREVRGDHFPYPLLLLFRVIGAWNHGGDPTAPLLIDEPIARLRREVEKGSFFQDLIARYMLDNPHRATLTLYPDLGMAAAEESGARAVLDDLGKKLAREEREKLIGEAEALRQSQEAELDLSCLPTLRISDIERKERIPEIVTTMEEKIPVSWCDQPTNGIVYVSIHMDAADIPGEILPWLSFQASTVGQVGAAGMDYARMAERIEAYTGGVDGSVEILEKPDELDTCRMGFEIRGRALYRNTDFLIGILTDVLLAPDYSDLSRLKTLVGQVATSLGNSIPQSGHRYASGRAAAGLTRAASIRESWSGISYLGRMKEASGLEEKDLEPLAKTLGEIAARLARRGGVRVGITAERDHFDTIRNAIVPLLKNLPAEDAPRHGEEGEKRFEPEPRAEGLAASVPVSYVARVFRTVPYVHPDTAALLVLAKILRFGYLHREIREKGGAYGGMAVVSPGAGYFSLMSYRDPHITRTLRVYRDAVEWAARGEFTEENIREAVLGVIGDLDTVLSPEGRGLAEFRYLRQGITPEMRQALRGKILSIRRGAIVDAAKKYLLEGFEKSAMAVLSAPEAIEAARQEPEGGGISILRV